MPDYKTVKLSGRGVTKIGGFGADAPLKRFYGVKTLKALPGAGLSPKQIKTIEGESFIPVAVEDAIPFWNERCGEQGKKLVEALAMESIERRTYDKAGIEVNEQLLNEHIKTRLQNKKQYHPYLTKWLQVDGCKEGKEYAKAINIFKASVKLPLHSVDKYTTKELQQMNEAEIRYDCLRKIGKTHKQALVNI